MRDYILRSDKPLTGDPAYDRQYWDAIAKRLTALNDARARIRTGQSGFDNSVPKRVASFRKKIDDVRRTGLNAALREVLSDDVLEFAAFIVFEMFRETVTGLSTYGEFPRDINLDAVDYNKTNLSFIKDLYTTALPDDVHMLDDLLKFEKGIRTPLQRWRTTTLRLRGSVEVRLSPKSLCPRSDRPSSSTRSRFGS